MGLGAVFESKKILAIVAVALIAAGLFADFITTVVWFSRINPYFAHGSGKTSQTYGGVVACFVFSAIALLAVIVLVALGLWAKSLFEKISDNNLLSLICVTVIGALCIGNIIAGLVAAAPAVKTKKIKEECDYYDPETHEPIYCEKDAQCYESYNEGMEHIYQYYCGGDDENYLSRALKSHKKFNNRTLNMLKKFKLVSNRKSLKSIKSGSNDIISTSLQKGKNVKGDDEYSGGKCFDYLKWGQGFYDEKTGNYKPDICTAVGIPTILFSVIEIVGIFLFLIVAIPNLTNGSGGNQSDKENA